jgi:hypothetical protein
MQYPAVHVVHWPTGPVHACEKHSRQLEALAAFLGTFAAITESDGAHECSNCVNGSRKTLDTKES